MMHTMFSAPWKRVRDDPGSLQSRRDRLKPPTLEGKGKDGSQQHNQLKQLVSYFFAIFVLWKLLP